MNYRSSDELLVSLENFTLWITLNRADASNAFTSSMIEELVSLLYRADEDQEVRTIVITGAGKHFCAGGDVKAMQTKTGMFAGESNELRERYKKGIQKIPRCLNYLSTPVIAMINGAAIGAGLDLACMCDIRVASVKAKFGETFSKLGLIPGDGGAYFLQRIVGYAKAMELTLTARVFDALEAREIGLVNYVVEQEDLKSKTTELVSTINQNAPIATQMAKKAIVHAYKSDLDSHLELLAAFQGITQRTQDHQNSVSNIFGKSQTQHFHK